MTQRAKWLGVGGLGIVWVVLVYVYVIDVPPPQEVPLKFKTGQVAASSTAKSQLESWEVKPLQAQILTIPATPQKNIFATVALPLSLEEREKIAMVKKKRAARTAVTARPSVNTDPVVVPPSSEELARIQAELAEKDARQQEELRRQRLQAQMAQYRYLGYLNQQGVQKAFLGKEREIYILRQGDTLDGTIFVASIEPLAVTIRETESKLETILKLKKEELQAAGR